MGLSLFNRRICNTYSGVIKTCDNTPITVTPKPMTDGVGNDVPINIGTSTICYGGTQDFSGATVIGISGATAGLVPGAGTSSMVSDIGITATALQSCSIAIGNAAYNCCERSINIGDGSTGLNSYTIGIGFATSNTGRNSIALGNSSASTATCSISIGSTAQSGGDDAIGIGTSSNARCNNSISIGAASDVLSIGATAVGAFTCVGPSANSSAVLGQFASSFSDCSTAIGRSSCVGTCANRSIAIGCGAFVAGSTLIGGTCCSIAIGPGAKVCDGAGPNGSIYSIAIGRNATTSCFFAISLGSSAESTENSAIAIGIQAKSCGLQSLAVGVGAQATATNSISIGTTSCVYSTAAGCQTGQDSVVIGTDSCAYNVDSAIVIGCGSTASSSTAAPIVTPTIAIGYRMCVTENSIGIGEGSAFVNILGGSNVSLGIQNCTSSVSSHSIAIGQSSCIVGTIIGGISIGCVTSSCASHSTSIGSLSKSCAACSVALGYNVCSNRVGVVTSCEFESCVAGCGLIVKTPDGLNSYRIAVDNSGNITTALA